MIWYILYIVEILPLKPHNFKENLNKFLTQGGHTAPPASFAKLHSVLTPPFQNPGDAHDPRIRIVIRNTAINTNKYFLRYSKPSCLSLPGLGLAILGSFSAFFPALD